MKPSIKRLREAKWKYLSARQARYDELMADFSGSKASDECLNRHDEAVVRINLEEQAVEVSSMDCVQTSANAYICDDKLYLSDWENHTRDFKFDLS